MVSRAFPVTMYTRYIIYIYPLFCRRRQPRPRVVGIMLRAVLMPFGILRTCRSYASMLEYYRPRADLSGRKFAVDCGPRRTGLCGICTGTLFMGIFVCIFWYSRPWSAGASAARPAALRAEHKFVTHGMHRQWPSCTARPAAATYGAT